MCCRFISFFRLYFFTVAKCFSVGLSIPCAASLRNKSYRPIEYAFNCKLLTFAVVFQDEPVQLSALVAGSVQGIQKTAVHFAGLRDDDFQQQLSGPARLFAFRLNRLEFVQRQRVVGEHGCPNALRVKRPCQNRVQFSQSFAMICNIPDMFTSNITRTTFYIKINVTYLAFTLYN